MMTLMGIRTTTFIRTMFVAMLGIGTGCSFVLDSDTGLGPPGCFLGTPTTQAEYLNACSTAKYVAFDNCERLGLCSGLMPPTTTEPSTGKSPGLMNQGTKPTNLCTDPSPGAATAPSVIYLYGSADFGPLLNAAQPSLYPAYRAVFQGATSCQGVDAIYKDDASRPVLKDPLTSTTGYAFYFDEGRHQVNCLIDVDGIGPGKPADVGISNLYADTCGAQAAPGITPAEYFGPVVPFVLSVPAASSQQAISAEGLHFVFGLGGRAPSGTLMKDASPWIDWNSYFIRNSNSGSTVLTALLAEVPKNKFWGVDRLSTENLRDALLTSPSPDNSIGILSIDFNDKYRPNLRALYLQSKGQSAGYLPDATPQSLDKINVRNGHYPLWGYVHLFTRLVSGGEPTAQAKAMVLLFNLPKLERRLVDDIIAASLTPQCAMQVNRSTEMGDFSPKTGFRCGCYFDFMTTGKASCKKCMTSDECSSDAPSCNYGYCEKN
jgi:hypothetical protein